MTAAPPTRIDRLPPGAARLEPEEDWPDRQWRQAVAWYDDRIRHVGGTPTAAELLSAVGLVAGRPETSRSLIGTRTSVLRLGPSDASTAVILATAEAIDEATLGWIADAVTAGTRVVIPAFVRRDRRATICRRLGKDRRHILHRLAFPLRRPLVALEAEVLADLIDAEQRARRRVVLVGLDDGIRASILATHLVEAGRDAELITASAVSAAATSSGGPIDRLIHGEAGLGSPDVWPTAARSRKTVRRAAVGRAVRVAFGSPGPASGLPVDVEADLTGRSDATFRWWLADLETRIREADRTRARRWRLESTPRDGRRRVSAAIRQRLGDSVEGDRSIASHPPASPRARLLRVTGDFVAYEVVLDTGVGLDVWGQLLVPRSRRRRNAAVVAQHGLGGTPGDVTGIGAAAPPDRDAYHAFGARLAERGCVVFAPYLTVPEQQDAAIINSLVVKAAALGEQRSRLELIKLRTVIDWLSTLPSVRPDRIGYYGLSYGGHAALWIAGLEPRFRAVVVSGHANDWTAKTTDLVDPRSFMAHPDEDFTTWGGTLDFSHLELVSAAWPRPTMIEAASKDPITKASWFDRVAADLERWAVGWDAADRIEIDRFEGVHEVTGAGSFEFLDRWLRPGEPFVRDYEYALPTARELPGIGDITPDLDPFLSRSVGVGETLDLRFPIARGQRFGGVAIRLSADADPGDLEGVRVRYRTRTGETLGATVIDGRTIHALWDLWYEAPIEPRTVRDDVIVSIAPAGKPDAGVIVYGPRPLGASDRRFRPAVRRAGAVMTGEPTHGFARTLLEGLTSEPDWTLGQPLTRTYALADSAGATLLRDRVLSALRHVAVETTSRADMAVHALINPGLPGGPRSHVVEVTDASIRLVGRTDRGLLAAVDSLRTRIDLDRALRPMRIERTEIVHDRVTTGVMPAGTRYREADLPTAWSDGALERVAQSGFTGIWTWVNLEDVTVDSTVLPELGDPRSATRLERLERLAHRADAFGLDLWAYLAIGYRQPPSDTFWRRHPDLRGGDGWMGPAMCTSNPQTLRHQRQVVEGLLRRAPSIAGLFVIFDIEGFYFCGSEEEARSTCPRCRARTSEDLAAEVLENLAVAVGPELGRYRLVAWSYGSRPDWVERLVPNLPGTVEFQADISKGVIVRRGSAAAPAGDDTIAEIGPSPVFERLRRAASGRRFWAKTEHAISLDAIFVPYLPVLDQFAARAMVLRESGATGWFTNWMHYGFADPVPGALLNAFAYDPLPDPSSLLDELATAWYGAAAGPCVRRAWSAFSEAIRAFPYSDPIARSPGPIQKGPTNPLLMDGTAPSFGSWRAWQNDLLWTDPWGVPLARACLRDVLRWQRIGVHKLREGLGLASHEDRRRLDAELRIALVWSGAVETMLALIDWITERDGRGDTGRLATIARRQRRLAARLYKVVDQDSRLGFAQDGGGVIRGGLFTPSLVRQAIGQLDDLLACGLVDDG